MKLSASADVETTSVPPVSPDPDLPVSPHAVSVRPSSASENPTALAVETVRTALRTALYTALCAANEERVRETRMREFMQGGVWGELFTNESLLIRSSGNHPD